MNWKTASGFRLSFSSGALSLNSVSPRKVGNGILFGPNYNVHAPVISVIVSFIAVGESGKLYFWIHNLCGFGSTSLLHHIFLINELYLQ